ncbi:hypothetical protein SPND219_01626 [Streptococcus pneumoniae]|nr:hypothetical protein SPND219_01626 [Streptococcus pneumoniae]AOG56392.1 hypothetical protein SPND122_01527 [Streptococcus pneumoniae]AOG58549.1 hypothetical protein SPND141_01532 [Streptococcus pneumoniae]
MACLDQFNNSVGSNKTGTTSYQNLFLHLFSSILRLFFLILPFLTGNVICHPKLPDKISVKCLYSSKIQFKPRQRRLAMGMVTDFVSSIHNLKAVL